MSNFDEVTFVVQKANTLASGASPLRLPADPHSPGTIARAQRRRQRRRAGQTSTSASDKSHGSSDDDSDDDDDGSDVASNSTEERGSFYDSDGEDFFDAGESGGLFDDDDGEDDAVGEGYGSYNNAYRKRLGLSKEQKDKLPGQVVLWDSAAQQAMDPPIGLRTWDGVFLPVVLNVLGLIVFVKLPYLVAQCGLMLFWGILGICYAVSGFTTISIAALSTNGHVGTGGPYHFASRVLGAGVGLAVGCSFLIGNIVTGAFFVTGSSHFALQVLHVQSIEDWSNDSSYLATIVTASILLLLLLGVAVLKLSRAFRILSVVLIAVAIIDVLVVCLQRNNIGVHGFLGFSMSTLHANLWPKFQEDLSFESALAVLFPSVGGILCGITLSGEIRHAAKAIPRGIGYAWITTLIIYAVISFFVAASFDRAVLSSKARSSLMDVSHKYLYIPGALMACFAAVLANIVGTSRVFYAMVQDDLIPGVPGGEWLRSLSKEQCVLLCWGAMQLSVFAIGTHYNAASIVGSLVILSCYVALNLGCFLAGISGVASFRPIYNIFSDYSALIGASSSFVQMFIIHPLGAAIIIFLHFSSQFTFAAKMDPARIEWGDASQPLTFFFVRKLLLNLDERREHIRHWRPSLLHLVTDVHLSQNLIGLATNLKKGGLQMLLHVIEGDFERTSSACHWTKSWMLDFINAAGMKAFCVISFGDRLRSALQYAMRGSGLGGMRPNSVLLSLDELLDVPKHRATAPPSVAELAIFGGPSAASRALLRNAGGTSSDGGGAVLSMGRLSSLGMSSGVLPHTPLSQHGSDGGGSDAQVMMQRRASELMQTVSMMRQHTITVDGAATFDPDAFAAALPDSSAAHVLADTATVNATIMRRASRLLTQPDKVKASAIRAVAAANEQPQQQSYSAFISRRGSTLSSPPATPAGAQAQQQQPQQQKTPTIKKQQLQKALISGDGLCPAKIAAGATVPMGRSSVNQLGSINLSISDGGSGNSPAAAAEAQPAAVAESSSSPPAAAAAETSPFSGASPESNDRDRDAVAAAAAAAVRSSPTTGTGTGKKFPSEEETKRHCGTLNEDLGDEERLQMLLDNLRMYRNMATFTGSADSLTYKDDAEFCSMAYDVVKLHLNLFVARNMWKLDGLKIRNEGCRDLPSDDEDENEDGVAGVNEEEKQEQQQEVDEDGNPIIKKRPFYIDLISPDPADAVIFLTAFCLSRTAVWKSGARLRVIDFVPTELDMEDAANARRQMLKYRKITADVHVIALDSLPPAAHEAVDAVLEADIVHHQRIAQQQRKAARGNWASAKSGLMSRLATTASMRRTSSSVNKQQQQQQKMRRSASGSALLSPSGREGSPGSSNASPQGRTSTNSAHASPVSPTLPSPCRHQQMCSTTSNNKQPPHVNFERPTESSLEPLLNGTQSPTGGLDNTSTGLYGTASMGPMMQTMMSAGGCMRGPSDLASNGTAVSSRASDIGYIRRVLASSRKRSQLVSAVYNNHPELSERTGIVFARVPAFPSGPLTDVNAKQWLTELKSISEGLPPMLMCCGEGALASSDDW